VESLEQILVGRGWVQKAQLRRAQEAQRSLGGSLGTNLLEMGAISEEQLHRALSEQFAVPWAEIDALRQAPEDVWRRLPETLAVRCKAAAFHLAGTALHVAMLDPGNLACQDEIAFACGKRIHVHVAAEVRIAEALDRTYGHEPSSRLAALIDQLNRSRYLWKGESSTAESGRSGDGRGRGRNGGDEVSASPPIHLPEWTDPVNELFPEQPLPAPLQPVPSPQTAPPEPVAEPAPAPEPTRKPVRREPPTSIKLSPEELRRLYPETPAARIARPAPRPDAGPGPRPPAAEKQPGADAVTTAALFTRATEALAAVRDRDQVGRILLDLLGALFDRAALFVVRGSRVEGWMGQGGGIDPERLANLVLSLEVPSAFLNLRAGSPFHLGPLAPVPAHRELADCWGAQLPAGSLLVPVHLQGRLVAVLYGDRGERPLADLPLGRFQELAQQTATAFERCIVLKKQRTSEPGGS
jgi:hypothetical protein